MQNGEGKLAPANSSSASCFSLSQAVSRASTVPPTVQPSLPISTPSSSNAERGSSTQIISALVSALQTHLDGVVKPPQNSADWTQEEVTLSKKNAAKFVPSSTSPMVSKTCVLIRFEWSESSQLPLDSQHVWRQTIMTRYTQT
jgi:hypothetical protein